MSFDEDFNGRKLIDTLLEPTRIYVKEFKRNKDKIKALCHITGGGITENLPRALPDGLKAVVKKENIRVLDIFKFLSKYVEEDEMYRTFNMGVGMVWIVDSEDYLNILKDVSDSYVIGEIKKGNNEVEYI